VSVQTTEQLSGRYAISNPVYIAAIASHVAAYAHRLADGKHRQVLLQLKSSQTVLVKFQLERQIGTISGIAAILEITVFKPNDVVTQ
jgi:hypothetical protein